MKKRWILPVGLGIAGVLVVVGWLLHDRLGASMLGSELSSNGTLTVGVPALATDPASYRGELRVKGVVARVHPERHLFSLADLHCRKKVLAGHGAGCMAVPIRWEGAMPALYGDVQVEGEVEASQQRPIFVADAVNILSRKPLSAGTK